MSEGTLTRSLHTVTAVANLALYLITVEGEALCSAEGAVRAALGVLGYGSDWPVTDATLAQCIKRVDKARGAGKPKHATQTLAALFDAAEASARV